MHKNFHSNKSKKCCTIFSSFTHCTNLHTILHRFIHAFIVQSIAQQCCTIMIVHYCTEHNFAHLNQNMASRASEKMNKSPCSSRCCLAAVQRGNGHGYRFLYSRTRRGYITRLPCPWVLPRGHTTQLARGEIFKLSLVFLESKMSSSRFLMDI